MLSFLHFSSSLMETTFIGVFIILVVFFASNGSAFRKSLLSTKRVRRTVRKHSISLDSSLRESMEWWDSLSPPFHNEKTEDMCVNADVTHFLFLLHGHRGFSRDLSYLESVMQKFAVTQTRKKMDKTAANACRQEMVVYSATSNERRTTDGIVRGGNRVVEEVIDFIRRTMENRQNEKSLKHITVSVLGNSLGGMYARYAISKLADLCKQIDGSLILDDKYQVDMNVFCTTASPHLGVASHTFLPLPRQAEIGVAHAMGETGKDLFRLNSLLMEMATEERYVGPLRRFRKRIAYANAYGTDFPVPAHTAAFLSTSSKYPHHFVSANQDANSLVVASVKTVPQRYSIEKYYDVKDDLSIMAASLDAIGWTKVFVDVRREIPNISLPNVSKLIRRKTTESSSADTDGSDNDEKCSIPINDDVEEERRVEEALHCLQQNGEPVSSRDVAVAVTSPFFDEKIYWPSGHNMIVAFSRSRLSTYLNKAGRPVVDSLAKDLVTDIFSWGDNDTSAEPTPASK